MGLSNCVVLQPVDSAEITVLVDNSIDVFLADGEIAKRPVRAWDPKPGSLRAEHGLSLLLTVENEGHSESVLYDAGLGRDTVIHNLDVLQIRVHDLRALVMSHGHIDHYGGVEGLVRRVGRRGLPLVLHPDVWKDRKLVFPTGGELHTPPPSFRDLEGDGIEVVEGAAPSLLIDGTVLVTGQVERGTDFEQGFPFQYARAGDAWEPDFWVWDDQALVVNVRGKGLVVLSGCSHAGIINILRYAQALTGVNEIYGVVGGFHLTGPVFEPLIPRTIDELAAINPAVVVPGHCTGWKAIHEIARRLPAAYVQTSVGSRLRFTAAQGRAA